jgi:hypothetical protein
LLVSIVDNIWLGKFSNSKIKALGAEHNIVILLFLLLTSLCSLYIVIPFKFYELQHWMNSLRLIWIVTFTSSYLHKYVGGMWTSPIVSLGTTLFALCQALRFSEIFYDNDHINTIHYISLSFNVTSNLIFLFMIIRWCYSIRFIKFKDYTLRIYSCNVYLTTLLLLGLSIWLLGIIYHPPLWYDSTSTMNVYFNYIMYGFMIGVTLLQHSAANIDLVVSLSEVYYNLIYKYSYNNIIII